MTASPLSVTAAPAGVAPSDTSTVRGARPAVFISVWPLEYVAVSRTSIWPGSAWSGAVKEPAAVSG